MDQTDIRNIASLEKAIAGVVAGELTLRELYDAWLKPQADAAARQKLAQYVAERIHEVLTGWAGG